MVTPALRRSIRKPAHHRDLPQPRVQGAAQSSAGPPVDDAQLGMTGAQRRVEDLVDARHRFFHGQPVKVHLTGTAPR